MREFATDLVRRQVAVIVAADGPVSVLAAMAATSTIPIVFVNGADPIRYGFVPRLNRPSSNVTGTTFVTAELEAKRLDLLLQLVPQVSTVAYLLGPSTNPIFENLRNDMLAAASALKRQIITLEVRRLDFEGAFAPPSRGAHCRWLRIFPRTTQSRRNIEAGVALQDSGNISLSPVRRYRRSDELQRRH